MNIVQPVSRPYIDRGFTQREINKWERQSLCVLVSKIALTVFFCSLCIGSEFISGKTLEIYSTSIAMIMLIPIAYSWILQRTVVRTLKIASWEHDLCFVALGSTPDESPMFNKSRMLTIYTAIEVTSFLLNFTTLGYQAFRVNEIDVTIKEATLPPAAMISLGAFVFSGCVFQDMD